MNRREFLYGTTALTLPVMAGCDNSDEPLQALIQTILLAHLVQNQLQRR